MWTAHVGLRVAAAADAEGDRQPADVLAVLARLPQSLLVRALRFSPFDFRPISRSDPARISNRRHSTTFTLHRSDRSNYPEMIPDTESVCRGSEAAVRSGAEPPVYQQQITNGAEKEVASVTAWMRYQKLVATIESTGGKLNRKSMIDAIFRGSDLVYASH